MKLSVSGTVVSREARILSLLWYSSHAPTPLKSSSRAEETPDGAM